MFQQSFAMDSTDVAKTEEESTVANSTVGNAEDGTEGAPRTCWRRLHSAVTVEPVLFLYALGFVSYMPALQQYVHAEIGKKHGRPTNNTPSDTCSHSETTDDLVQSLSSEFMLLMNAACLPSAFLITMFLGRYSDGRGRRIALIPPVLGATLRAFLTLAVVHWQLNLYVLIAVAFLESATGGFMTMLMACFAYITDVSSTKTRALRILILEAMLTLGVAMATMATGYIIHIFGFEYSFLFALSVQVVNVPLVLFYVKETITTKVDIKFFTLTHIVETARLFSRDPERGRRWKLITVLLVFTLVCVVDIGSQDVTTFFLLGRPLCFSPVLIGYYQGATYLARGFWGLVLLKLLYHWLQDTGLMIFGCVAGIAAQVMLAFSHNWIMAFTVPLIIANESPIGPLCRAFASKLVHPKEIGTLFAAIAFGQQLSHFVGAIVFNLIYSKTVAIFAGIAFFVGAGMFLMALLLAVGLHVGVRRQAALEKTDAYGAIN